MSAVKEILSGKSVRSVLLESVDRNTLLAAQKHAEGFKGATVDLENHVIIIPLYSNSTEEELMSDGMLGAWFRDNGFDVSFSRGDVEYQTKPQWTNYRGMQRSKGHTAYLRNRLILTARW